MLRAFWIGLAFCVATAVDAGAQPAYAPLIDHLHLAAPDQAKAVAWYHELFGGEATSEGPDRLMFGATRLVFQRSQPQPSAGSVLDHVGFAVADLDATLRAVAASGGKVVEPARDVAGLFRLAFIEDPWGTRIEVVQDGQQRGLHHVHLRAPDPAKALAWYGTTFGGRTGKLKDRIDGIDYGGVWLLVTRGDTVPSRGHAIDHIGFRPLNVDSAIAALKASGATIESEPRSIALPGGAPVRIAFVEGIDAVRIELVQR